MSRFVPDGFITDDWMSEFVIEAIKTINIPENHRTRLIHDLHGIGSDDNEVNLNRRFIRIFFWIRHSRTLTLMLSTLCTTTPGVRLTEEIYFVIDAYENLNQFEHFLALSLMLEMTIACSLEGNIFSNRILKLIMSLYYVVKHHHNLIQRLYGFFSIRFIYGSDQRFEFFLEMHRVLEQESYNLLLDSIDDYFRKVNEGKLADADRFPAMQRIAFKCFGNNEYLKQILIQFLTNGDKRFVHSSGFNSPPVPMPSCRAEEELNAEQRRSRDLATFYPNATELERASTNFKLFERDRERQPSNRENYKEDETFWGTWETFETNDTVDHGNTRRESIVEYGSKVLTNSGLGSTRDDAHSNCGEIKPPKSRFVPNGFITNDWMTEFITEAMKTITITEDCRIRLIHDLHEIGSDVNVANWNRRLISIFYLIRHSRTLTLMLSTLCTRTPGVRLTEEIYFVIDAYENLSLPEYFRALDLMLEITEAENCSLDRSTLSNRILELIESLHFVVGHNRNLSQRLFRFFSIGLIYGSDRRSELFWKMLEALDQENFNLLLTLIDDYFRKVNEGKLVDEDRVSAIKTIASECFGNNEYLTNTLMQYLTSGNETSNRENYKADETFWGKWETFETNYTVDHGNTCREPIVEYASKVVTNSGSGTRDIDWDGKKDKDEEIKGQECSSEKVKEEKNKSQSSYKGATKVETDTRTDTNPTETHEKTSTEPTAERHYDTVKISGNVKNTTDGEWKTCKESNVKSPLDSEKVDENIFESSDDVGRSKVKTKSKKSNAGDYVKTCR